jgi:hypothetical protein
MKKPALDLPHCFGSVNYLHQCWNTRRSCVSRPTDWRAWGGRGGGGGGRGCLGRMGLARLPCSQWPRRRSGVRRPLVLLGVKWGARGEAADGGWGRLDSRARSGRPRRSFVRRPTLLAEVRWGWGAGGGGGRMGLAIFPGSQWPSPPVRRPPASGLGRREVGRGSGRRRGSVGAGSPPRLAQRLPSAAARRALRQIGKPPLSAHESVGRCALVEKKKKKGTRAGRARVQSYDGSLGYGIAIPYPGYGIALAYIYIYKRG